jgi:hypothetical protein
MPPKMHFYDFKLHCLMTTLGYMDNDEVTPAPYRDVRFAQ